MKKIVFTVILTVIFFPKAVYYGENSDTPERKRIKEFLQAVADVVEFDCDNYNFDRLIKNILYTSKNYEVITDFPRDYRERKLYNGEKIKSVSGEFVDDILKTVFGIEPRHNSMNNIVEKNMFYTNGRYFFKGGYTADFHTKIENIERVYNLGGGRYYIIFCDKYSQEDVEKSEYGYAILDEYKDNYKLIKLSIGGELLDDDKIKGFAKTSPLGFFFCDGEDFLYVKQKEIIIKILYLICTIAILMAIVVLILALLSKRRK